MIVNEQEANSRAKYWDLKNNAPKGVPVYQQDEDQQDVWEVLDGDKEDFLIYDRCGLLTFHLVIPYSYLFNPFVEAAIRVTYYNNICNCSYNSTSSARTRTRPRTDEELKEGDRPDWVSLFSTYHHPHHFQPRNRSVRGADWHLGRPLPIKIHHPPRRY
uniref:Selenoprotein Pb-like n=2 Tax=Kryptolebias marmoratus TaxID=37003 RepID=A0A3Q3BDP3_KRYMA